jgi:Tetratricopeptide repeat
LPDHDFNGTGPRRSERPEPWPLAIRLLGSLEVRIHGEPMPRLRMRACEWILALLVLRHEQPLSRSWLAGTLWPDSPEERARLNLRVRLVDLRKALGPETERLRSPTRDTLRLDHALKHLWGIACAANNVGQALCHLGQPARARVVHLEALALYHGRRSLGGMAWSLRRVGIVEAMLGNAEKAARLLGAGEGMRERSGVALHPFDQAELDRVVETARGPLGTRRFGRAWAEGGRMSADEAVALARSRPLPRGFGL